MTSPDLSALTADFGRLGYVTIPEVISPELRSRMRSVAEILLRSTITRGRDRGADGKDGFRGVLALNPDAFLPVIASPRVLPVVAELFGPNIHILSTHLIALPSIAPGQPRSIRTPQRPGWHRDMFGVTADLGQVNTPRMAIKCAYYLTRRHPQLRPDHVPARQPAAHRATADPARPDRPTRRDHPGLERDRCCLVREPHLARRWMQHFRPSANRAHDPVRDHERDS